MGDDKTASFPKITFIRDEPAEVDFFQSHERLALALATVIEAQPELRIIGLLGDWGSGKSTVVRFMKKHLESTQRAPDIYCFEYDTWLHQSDPPRRAFLEALIHFLADRKLTHIEEWEEKLDQLNGRIEDKITKKTPTLTPAGRLVLPFLLLWPVGLTLAGYETIKDAFAPVRNIFELSAESDLVPKITFFIGATLLVAPVIVAAAIYLGWRRWGDLWSRKILIELKGPFWSLHKAPHKNDTIISIFANKAVEQTHTRLVKTPDPTAMEFRDFFREVMAKVGAERRFVFIIDNLDRLPPEAALNMWATIRSFFLGAEEVGGVEKSVHSPTVILPVDERGVQAMHGGVYADALTELSDPFIEKLFDATFHVTPPVSSSWHEYISGQMKKVFGDLASDEPLTKLFGCTEMRARKRQELRRGQ